MAKKLSAAKEAFSKEIREYYAVEWEKALNLDVVSDKKTREWLKSAGVRRWSHFNRIVRNVQVLKHTFLMEKTSMIAACFKVTYKSTSCIYGYLYSTVKQPEGKRGQPEIVHRYACCSPTFRSQDGEYRHRFQPWPRFQEIWDKYYEFFEPIEKMIVERVESGAKSFQVDFFYPDGVEVNQRKFEDDVNVKRIAIKLFVMAWFCDFFRIHNKIMENHINPAYQYIVYQAKDIPIYQSIVDKIGANQYRLIIHRISRWYQNINNPDYNIAEIECGQKLFPVTVFEAIKTGDINFSIWRELYINNMCSDLVLNMISPSFPFINNWFYVQNAHGGMFDNIAMHDKYTHGEIAADISTQLRNTDKYNYNSGDRTKGPVNSDFMRLSRHIQKSIIYADSAIRLTDLSICITNEHVGRTLRDIPVLVANPQYAPGYDLAFADLDTFSKHMFEFIYGFYCMNTKIGVFHGDLHLNNATLFKLYTMKEGARSFVDNPHIAYILSDDVYLFPHYGIFGMIIDYSRAVIGDKSRLERDFGEKFADQYFKEQRTNMMRVIHHYFTKFYEKNRDALEGLILNNFQLMFKILSAVDAYSISTNLAAMFSIDELFTRGKIKLVPGATKLLAKLGSTAEAITLDNLQKALDGKIKLVDDIEWPNLVLIRRCFEEYRILPEELTKHRDANVVEIFNYNNEVKYSVAEYDTWGPLLSITKDIELMRKHKVPIDEGTREWMEFAKLDESKEMDEIVSKYVELESESINLEDWMLK